MKKLLPLALLLIFLLSACLPTLHSEADDTPDPNLPAPQSLDELYSLYDEVTRDMTKSDLDARFGEPTPSLDEYGEVMFYNYYNETKSAGVSVIFDYDDNVSGKILFFNSKTNLIPFSSRYVKEKIKNLDPDMTIEEAFNEMGSIPLEISCDYTDNGPESSKNIYAWYNEDGSNLMLHTENGIVKNLVRYE